MKLPKSFTKVTTFSKLLALSMLIIIPILAFFYGQYYERVTKTTQPTTVVTPTTAEGTFCGGPDAIQCDPGYFCDFEGGNYLTEGGTCIKQKPRQQAKEGEFCGGIAGMQCSDGYRCKFSCLDGSTCDDSQYPYPDAGGVCVKN